MKVLQLINSLGAGGAEKLLIDATITYSKLGIEVDILVLKNVESPFINKLKDYPKIKLFSLSQTKSVYNPLLIFKLKKYFKNYDVVHVHLFPCLYWAGISSIFNKNYRLIFTEHNTTNRRRSSILFKMIDKFIYKRYDDIVSISDSVDSKLKEHLGKSFNSKISKIYNGIDLIEITKAKPYKKRDLEINDQDVALLQVSSFTPQKNQNFIIECLTKLPNNYHLFLAGDGELKKSSKTFAKQNEVENRVHFLGIRNDIPRLLKSVDIVLLSSHFEGLSLSSVEGMASGKPFLASDVPGLTEVVRGAGILFENDNMGDFCNKLMSLVSNKNQYDAVSLKCRERARKYDILNMCNQYNTLYQKNSY